MVQYEVRCTPTKIVRGIKRVCFLKKIKSSCTPTKIVRGIKPAICGSAVG